MNGWKSQLGVKSKQEPIEFFSAEPQSNTSLALNALYYQLRHEKKYAILDLGPALGANVEFFSQFSCRIHIEDLYHTLSSFDFFSPEDGFTYETVFEYLLPYTHNTRLDVILSWDIFNYLERDEFESLISHLGHFCHKGTLLFSLISTLKHIPDQPTAFRILDQETLQYQTRSNVLRPCPGYQQTDLNHLMPRFRVCNSFLLRNGFKEYLFVYE
jgi:hypothetical protein